jgi:hypothetical protein
MKWLPIALPLVFLAVATRVSAETPRAAEIKINSSISPGELTPTPEMWFYEQNMRQHQDPKTGVREKAEFRSAQRQDRMASRRWFGLSNLRPTAASDPIHGDYSPTWTSNNYQYPNRWSGVNGVTVLVRPESSKND